MHTLISIILLQRTPMLDCFSTFFTILFHTDINRKIKQASGFAEVVFHIVTAFFETPLGHRLLYEGIQAASYTNNKLGTRNHEL